MRYNPFTPKVGEFYDTRSASYQCIRLTEDGAVLRNVRSGWQFHAHGIFLDEEGYILWRCSTSGHFAEEASK